MIAIVDYGAGNVASVRLALTQLGVNSIITADPEQIATASGVIFPGQGRAGQARRALQQRGLIPVLSQLTQPFLGICLGMQLLVEQTDEDSTDCLGLLPGRCRKFDGGLPVPHVGWNQVQWQRDNLLTVGIKPNSYFYFVHSYYVATDREYVAATTRYGLTFTSLIAAGNRFGVQFHPEKSGPAGLQLLRNFCALC